MEKKSTEKRKQCCTVDAWIKADRCQVAESDSEYIKYKKKIRKKSETFRKKSEAEAVLHC